jgi:hypothetical protein
MILYKYIKSQFIDYVLKDRTIKFSKPSQFNDPFESLPFIEGGFSEEFITALFVTLSIDELYDSFVDSFDDLKFKRTLHSIREDLKQGEKNIKKWYSALRANNEFDLSQSLKETWSDNVGILSLSENSDNLTMWAHYAEDHKGFVVGFDTNKLISSQNQILIKLRKVLYTCERPKLNLFELDETREERNAKWRNNFYFRKSKDWAYENEWRQINKLNTADSSSNENYLYKINKESIACIIIGCKMEDNNKEKITAYTTDLDIDKFQMKINKSMYCLDKIKI